jgi:hypothetical protein
VRGATFRVLALSGKELTNERGDVMHNIPRMPKDELKQCHESDNENLMQ